MRKGIIIILSGPSGSGKTTLYKKLLRMPLFKGKIEKTVSVTTRSPRPGETHGRDYIFVSKGMFFYKRRSGHFLESQKVFDNYYGTTWGQVRKLLKTGKSVLLCIDVKGASVVRKAYPDSVSIFIKTPTLMELRRRLESRGSENPNVLNLRYLTALEELKQARLYDHIIVNDKLPAALSKLKKILLASLPD